jgi:hypothetical protein
VLFGVFGDIVSTSPGPGVTGDIAPSVDPGDFSGNLNFLNDHVSYLATHRIEKTYRSSLPSASGFGLFGRFGSVLAGRLACLVLWLSEDPLPPAPAPFLAVGVSNEAFLETVGLSNDPFLDELPTI